MIKHVPNRVVVKVDLNQKSGVTFADGTEIALVRDVDNFDRKYTASNLGIVIDAENIPKDAIVLLHHNAVHETYKIFNHSSLSGEEIASHVEIYSIMERDVFFWKLPEEIEWHPTKHFATAIRVFEPYTGILEGIAPKKIKDTLWITSGKYEGVCCRTLEAVDYCITFRCPTTGKDKNIIRLRPDGDEDREPEIIAIDNGLTEKIKNGKLLVGLTVSDCKPIN